MNQLDFVLRGEHIKLDQLLKASGLVDSGGAAHAAVEAGAVMVDGRTETRKRARLGPGQEVCLGSTCIRLHPAPS